MIPTLGALHCYGSKRFCFASISSESLMLCNNCGLPICWLHSPHRKDLSLYIVERVEKLGLEYKAIYSCIACEDGDL